MWKVILFRGILVEWCKVCSGLAEPWLWYMLILLYYYISNIPYIYIIQLFTMHKMITYFESNVFEMLENTSLDTSQGVKVVRDGAVSWFVGPRWDGHEMWVEILVQKEKLGLPSLKLPIRPGPQKERIVFQLAIFRGYVSFRDCGNITMVVVFCCVSLPLRYTR